MIWYEYLTPRLDFGCMAPLSCFAMSDNSSRSDEDKSSSDLDLSSLGELSLGPDWGSGSLPASKSPKWSEDRSGPRGRRDRRGPGGPGGPGGSRDRRAGKTARPAGGGQGSHDRPDNRSRGGRGAPQQGRGRGARQERPPFQPIIEADFYPDDNAFKALTLAIRQSFRTFELFEIARLILEKPERWVCVAKHPDQKEGETAILHASVPDGLPFLSEQAAIDHVLKLHLSEFFDAEDYEAEAPSGSFQMVHKCGFTSEIIGPPNFHRYQAMLKEHQATRLPRLSIERVQAHLESVREQEAIDGWLEKMKQGKRYTLKEQPEGGDPIIFPDLDAVRLYLLTHMKEKVVRPAYSVRFLGRDLTTLPESDPLRLSIETLYAQQMRFPLNTANNLRGRLRRLNLAVYKRGSKGVSYVCAVKRHFRTKDEVLAENLSNLMEFIEAHPKLKPSDLPREYLGITEPDAKVDSAEEVAAAAVTEPTEASAEEQPSTESVETSAYGDELKALGRDLRYLVSQGYVIEYSDGRLEVPPMKEEPVVEKAPAKAAQKVEEGAPAAETKEAVPVAEEPTAEAPTPAETAAPVEEPTAEAPTPAETPAPVEEPIAEAPAPTETAAPVEKPTEEKAVAAESAPPANTEPESEKVKPAAEEEPEQF